MIPMTTYSELTPVKKIHLDTLDMGDLETRECRAVMEILLQLANEELEVMISDGELRTLLAIYMKMFAAEPFLGLHELIQDDVEVELFFLEIGEVVLESDPEMRAEMFKEAYKTLCQWTQHPIRIDNDFGVLSAQGEALLEFAQGVLSLEYQWDIHLHKEIRGKTYSN